jgi:hypothetical protein
MRVSNGKKFGYIIGSPYEGWSLTGKSLFVRVRWDDGTYNDCKVNSLRVPMEVQL